MPQSPSPSNRLSFHWNSIKLTNIRRPWGEGNGGWGRGCWPGHRTTDWRTWHSSTLPSPSCIHSSNPSMSPRTRTDFQLCHKLRWVGEEEAFLCINCFSFFLVRFLHFVLLLSFRFSSLHALCFVVVAALLCSLILQWNLCAMCKVQRSVGRTYIYTYIHMHICMYTCMYVGACIKHTHTNKTHSNNRREQNCKQQQQQHNISYFQHSDQNRDPKQNVKRKQ